MRSDAYGSDYLQFRRHGCQVYVFNPFETHRDVYRCTEQRNSDEGRRECFRVRQKSIHDVGQMSRGLKED